MPTLVLSFSRPDTQILAHSQNFARLGFQGYRRVPADAAATRLATAIEALNGCGLSAAAINFPVFASTPEDGIRNYTFFDVSARFQGIGWQLPATPSRASH